jgi:hypothetical protein
MNKIIKTYNMISDLLNENKYYIMRKKLDHLI